MYVSVEPLIETAIKKAEELERALQLIEFEAAQPKRVKTKERYAFRRPSSYVTHMGSRTYNNPPTCSECRHYTCASIGNIIHHDHPKFLAFFFLKFQ